MLCLVGAVDITKSADMAELAPGDVTVHTWTLTNAGGVDLVDTVAIDALSTLLPVASIDEASITATRRRARP